MALSYAALRDSAPTGTATERRDVSSLKRRLWWSCYVMDHIMELNTGRRSDINLRNVQISPICLEDFEFCQPTSTNEQNSSVVLGDVFLQIQLAYLFRWRLETCHHLGFGTLATNTTGSKSLIQISEHMNEWRSSMSSQQKYNFKPSRESKLLEEHYDCLRLLHSIAVLNMKKRETCTNPVSPVEAPANIATNDLDRKRGILRHACEIVDLVNLLKAKGNAVLLSTSKETLQFSTFIILGQITSSSEPQPPAFPRDVRTIFNHGRDFLRQAWKENRLEIETPPTSQPDHHTSSTGKKTTQTVKCYEAPRSVDLESFPTPMSTCSSNAGYCGSCEDLSIPDHLLEGLNGGVNGEALLADSKAELLTVNTSWLVAV
jgi:hypothetical protein